MALRRCRDMGIRCCKHSADADLRTIRNQHKNAPHEVGRTETAGPGRTERSGYYPFSAAIPACVSTGPSSRKSIRPSSLKIRKSSSLTGDEDLRILSELGLIDFGRDRGLTQAGIAALNG